MTSRKKDKVQEFLINLCSVLTIAILVGIIGFIFWRGIPGINLNFLTRQWEERTTYVNVGEYVEYTDSETPGRVERFGVTLEITGDGVAIAGLDSSSSLTKGVDGAGSVYKMKKHDIIEDVDGYSVEDAYEEWQEGGGQDPEAFLAQITAELNALEGTSHRIKVMRPGGGIIPMVVTTLYMIGLCLIIAGPVGILASIYLVEYAKPGPLLNVIHFAIQNLAGIPSIIYGLFGSLFFVQVCRMQYSILAGAMTVSILLLPVIITATEEALKAIPRGYRESSIGLGATKLQTIWHVVLPGAVPGILSAVLLSIGRIVGESAALLLTAGTVATIPGALVGSGASGATLTIKAYTLMKEENDLQTACAIGIILLIIIFILQIASRWFSSRLLKHRGQ